MLPKLTLFILVFASVASAQTAIVQESYDSNRTSSNLAETILNQSDVNVGQFGKLFTDTVDGSIYAQPLYVPNVTINGASHNVIYVATLNDVVYAFDADTAGSPLWETDFRINGASPVTSPTNNITGNIGIEGTPVIDLSSNTIYVVAYTVESGNDVYRLHALDITTGAEKFGGPNLITASVPGTGSANVNNTLTFNPSIQMQRPGLAIANGMVFVSFGSFGDQGLFHGWIMAYDDKTLALAKTVCITPDGTEGALWQSGRAPVVDSSNNVYFMTANGDYDGVNDFGDSFVRYATGTDSFTIADWFTPSDFLFEEQNDEDLGSSGPLLIPGTSLILGAGKEGNLYVVNTTDMGKEWSGNTQIVQSFSLGDSLFTGPAFYNRSSNPELFLWPSGGYLSAYSFNGSTFNTTPVSQSTIQSALYSYSGAIAVSANANTSGTGIVWASTPTAGEFDGGTIPGILRAFSADNLATELWDSTMNSTRDAMGAWAKFRAPTVVNGKVYVGTVVNGATPAALYVYGLLSTGAAPPSNDPPPSSSNPPASSSNPPVTPTSVASLVARHTATQGNWMGVYGADGYNIAQSVQSIPSDANLTIQNTLNWVWASPTTDVRGLELPAGGRIASSWYSSSPFQFNVNLTDGKSRQLTFYMVDFDQKNRSETLQVSDAATGIVLDSESVTSFTGGIYLSWNVSGNVVVTVTSTGGPNAVVSGVFFGGPGSTTGAGTAGAPSTGGSGTSGGTGTSGGSGTSGGTGTSGGSSGSGTSSDPPADPPTTPTTATVQFVATDSSTQGSWSPKYGANGYNIVGITTTTNPTMPAYAVFSPQSTGQWTWASSTSDPRALRMPGTNSGVADAWYNTAFSMSLSFTDGATHQFSLYALDWDSKGRTETFTISDANSNAVLDTRTISSFTNGVYLVWNISGSVVINVTSILGPNAVVSGVFFDPIVTSAPGAAPGWVPQIVLNWTAVPTATSYNVYRGTQSGGPYVLVASPSSTTYTDTNVTPGVPYFYVVNGVNIIGLGPTSAEFSASAP